MNKYQQFFALLLIYLSPMKIKKIIPISFLLLLIFSCNKSENNDILIYELEPFTFSTPEAQGINSNVLNNAYEEATSL
jgi:hypothetical protein